MKGSCCPGLCPAWLTVRRTGQASGREKEKEKQGSGRQGRPARCEINRHSSSHCMVPLSQAFLHACTQHIKTTQEIKRALHTPLHTAYYHPFTCLPSPCQLPLLPCFAAACLPFSQHAHACHAHHLFAGGSRRHHTCRVAVGTGGTGQGVSASIIIPQKASLLCTHTSPPFPSILSP